MGYINLRSFLYNRGISIAPTPFCRCSSGEEIVYYILAEYILSRNRPAYIPLQSRRNAIEALSLPRVIGILIK